MMRKPTPAQLRFLLALVAEHGRSFNAAGRFRRDTVRSCRANGWVTIMHPEGPYGPAEHIITGTGPNSGRAVAKRTDLAGYAKALPDSAADFGETPLAAAVTAERFGSAEREPGGRFAPRRAGDGNSGTGWSGPAGPDDEDHPDECGCPECIADALDEDER
jgi:hypothetical protein